MISYAGICSGERIGQARMQIGNLAEHGWTRTVIAGGCCNAGNWRCTLIGRGLRGWLRSEQSPDGAMRWFLFWVKEGIRRDRIDQDVFANYLPRVSPSPSRDSEI